MGLPLGLRGARRIWVARRSGFSRTSDPGDFSLSFSTVQTRLGTSVFDRVSCKTQLWSTPSASLASYPRPSAGHRVLTSALRTVDAREIGNFTASRPKSSFGCSGAHEICRTCVAALRKADGTIQCPKCREEATGAVNPNRGLIAALRLSRRS